MLIKVCGMREPENIRQVADAGIDWMGFIFYARSPRYVAGELPVLNGRIKKVGVFVDATIQEVTETATRYRLDYLQLHGDESADYCHTLQKRGYSLIKAFAVATAEDLNRTADYEGRVDYFLFDTKCCGYGGSGKSFDWTVLDAYNGQTPFLLSGGIRPESVTAIRRFHHPLLAGIDLNSGFETEPGIKNAETLRTFVDEIKRL